MQAYFRLNNSILDCGLTPNELKVAVCLYSCVFNNRCVVQIKQATIAQKCGIKKIEYSYESCPEADGVTYSADGGIAWLEWFDDKPDENPSVRLYTNG